MRSFGQKAGYASGEFGIGLGWGNLAGGGIAAGAGSMLGQRIIQRGKKELTRTTENADYKDIEMGGLQQNDFDGANDVRIVKGVGADRIICECAEKCVEHLYERR